MDFWWIDWQQGESQGHTGQDGRPDGKMNPTMHLRTDNTSAWTPPLVDRRPTCC
jgi:hypothetical protein